MPALTQSVSFLCGVKFRPADLSLDSAHSSAHVVLAQRPQRRSWRATGAYLIVAVLLAFMSVALSTAAYRQVCLMLTRCANVCIHYKNRLSPRAVPKTAIVSKPSQAPLWDPRDLSTSRSRCSQSLKADFGILGKLNERSCKQGRQTSCRTSIYRRDVQVSCRVLGDCAIA